MAALALQQFKEPIRTDNLVVYPSVCAACIPRLTAAATTPNAALQKFRFAFEGKALASRPLLHKLHVRLLLPHTCRGVSVPNQAHTQSA